MTISTPSNNLYKKLQKQYSRKINLDLKRINFALKKLGNIHESIRNPINIIGSDGKYYTLKSLQNIIKEKGYKVTTFDPYVDDVDWVDEFETLPITYFIGTKHRSFKYFQFKQKSTIIDPFRYIVNRLDLKIIKIGTRLFNDY